MRVRTITQRNWLGGFLCGFIGILMMGLLTEWLAPVGGFVGFLVGFRYEEIVLGAAAYWRISLRKTSLMWRRISEIVEIFVLMFRALRVDISPLMKTLNALFKGFMWLIDRPLVVYRWLKRHPMNRAYTVLGLAFVFFYVLQVVIGAMILPTTAEFNEASAIGAFIELFGAIFAFIAVLMAPVLAEADMHDNPRGRMCWYYERYAFYTAYGPIAFFLRSIARMVLAELALFASFCGAFCYFLGGGALMTAFVFAPLAIVVGAFRGFWKIMARNDYWPGLIVSMAVMLTVGLFTQPYLQGTLLWTIALLTGTACGAASVAGQKTLLAYYAARPRLQAMVRLRTHRYLLPAGRAFMELASRVSDKAISTLQLAFS